MSHCGGVHYCAAIAWHLHTSTHQDILIHQNTLILLLCSLVAVLMAGALIARVISRVRTINLFSIIQARG